MTRRWGTAYSWVERYLEARDGGRKCFYCGRSDVALLVEHFDNDPRNPDPDNLHLSCWSCNKRKDPNGTLPQIERESRPREESPWNNQEGERHDKMRFVWDNLLYHPITGILKNEGARVSKSRLPSRAIDVIGYGSSKTTAWYMKEDLDNGYLLDTKDEDGTPMVEKSDKPYPLKRLGIKE